MSALYRWMLALLVIVGGWNYAAAQRPERGRGGPERFDPGHPGGMTGWMSRPVTPEEEQEAREFLRKINPGRVAHLDEMKTSEPYLYNTTIRRILWTKARLADMEGSDPEGYRRQMAAFQLESEAHDLALRYRQATADSDRQRLRAQLTDELARLFDLREADKRAEIEHLQRRLQELRRTVQERRRNKDAIVDRHTQELLGDLDTVEW